MSNLNTVITIKGRENMAKARAGLATMPVITGMAFGDGGVDGSGVPIPPAANATALNNELYRKAMTSITAITATTIEYKCQLSASELTGQDISELGLYDANGDLVMIKTFVVKSKGADEVLTFAVDDAF